MSKFNKVVFSLNIVIVLVIATIIVAYAWTNPSQNPPDGAGAIVAEPSAPVNSVYIKSDGNVGIGAIPGYKLDVVGDIHIGAVNVYRRGGTSGISATCPASSALKGITVSGGIVVGGTCVTAGTVSSVGTGSGLTGGPITTSGTISILTGGVTSAHIADGTIINADISVAAAISATKVQDVWVNAAGDTMTGNLTAPTMSTSALIIGGQNVIVNDGVVNQGTDPISWSKIRDVPARFTDGVIIWQELVNIPAGFADGVDNTGCTISASGCYWKNVSNINPACNAANEFVRGFNPDNDDVFCCAMICQ